MDKKYRILGHIDDFGCFKYLNNKKGKIFSKFFVFMYHLPFSDDIFHFS